MGPDDLQARREEARKAMEGEEVAKRREAETAVLTKRRSDARAAMESEEQKRVRINAEQTERSRAIAKERLAQDMEKRRQEENAKAEALKQKLASEGKKEKEQYDDRLRKIKQSELKINTVRQAPVSTLSSIHTLKSDMARTIRDEEMSMTKMVIQEKDRARMGLSMPGGMTTEKPKRGGKIGLLIFLIILLLAASGSAVLLIFFPNTATQITEKVKNLINGETVTTNTPTFKPTYLIPADEEVEVEVSKLDAEGLRSQIDQVFTNAKEDKALTGLAFVEGEKQIDFARFQSKLALGAPATLISKFGSKFLYGILNINETKNGFLIAEVSGATNENIMEWEPNLASRLTTLIGSKNATAVFNSRLFQNLEVRVLPDAFGASQMIYTIVGNRYLVITTNDKSLEYLISRLSLL